MSEEKTTTENNATDSKSIVRAKLAEYGIDDSVANAVIAYLGVDSIEELAALEVEDLTGIGVKVAKARKLVSDLKNTQKTAPVAATAAEARAISQYEALLPTVPSNESWLEALKTGGILKVDESSYIAAIRAALADKAGLYDVPQSLATAMEKYADETDEQVDPIYFTLLNAITRRSYSDIFSAIPGLSGSYITDKRRKEFLSRVRSTLWPAIAESYQTLNAWYESWRASFSDPSMLLAAIGGGLSGGAGVNMITPPDTSTLHSARESLVDSINRVFRGTGNQIAAAVAYDANNISDILEDNRLPALVGVKNREMMLKKIGANISSNYVRLEQNLVKYVLAFTKLDTVTSDVEVNYIVALWQLGAQINWNDIGIIPSNGITNLAGNRSL